MGENADPEVVNAGPADLQEISGGGIMEIAAARSWNYHTPPEEPQQ